MSKICIVTPDLLGPVKNGGIGTSCYFLAKKLAELGYQVSVLFTQPASHDSSKSWMKKYESFGVSVSILNEWVNASSAEELRPDIDALKISYWVYSWLREYDFDIVFFMEWKGNGFFSLQAKFAGVSFLNTSLVVQLHSPSIWHAANNASLLELSEKELMTHFIERKSIALADCLVSPSHYMLNWLIDHNFATKGENFVIPNLIDKPILTEKSADCKVVEIVFFGRLEYRKGLKQFCDAIDLLSESEYLQLSVTFLGKFAFIDDTHSGLYISNRMSKWRFPVSIKPKMDQEEAIAYLKEGGRLAVMPSISDNSPYTVYECLINEIPFIARDVGGVAELIDNESRNYCLFGQSPRSLFEKIVTSISSNFPIAKLNFSLDENLLSWQKFIESAIAENKVKSKTAGSVAICQLPLITVCLVHYERPELLMQAISSLFYQTYQKFEVILVDDGSTSDASRLALESLASEFRNREWTILRQDNSYLGKARNFAVEHARGEYILFMDDDNFAQPHMLESFSKTIVYSGADVVVSAFNVFESENKPDQTTLINEVFLPVGDALAYSILGNTIGDANSIFKRSLFSQVGGFTEDYGIGHEDFELLLKFALMGCTFAVIPEVLFWYRRSKSSMLSSTSHKLNRARSFRPFLHMLPQSLSELAVLAFIQSGKEKGDRTVRGDVGLDIDPDSPEAILTLSSNISSLSPVLAKSLLQDIRHQLPSRLDIDYQRVYIKTEIFNFIECGNLAKADEFLDKYLKFSEFPVESIYREVLPAIVKKEPNSKFTEAYSLRLLDSEGANCDSLLFAAKYLSINESVELSLRFLFKALSLSEKSYCLARPDVADAINAGSFESPLHHYLLHGKRENAVWLAKDGFSELIASLLEKLAKHKYPLSIFEKRQLIFLAECFFPKTNK